MLKPGFNLLGDWGGLQYFPNVFECLSHGCLSLDRMLDSECPQLIHGLLARAELAESTKQNAKAISNICHISSENMTCHNGLSCEWGVEQEIPGVFVWV